MFKFEKNRFNLFLILLILLSYFLGFYVREISNGAGHIDLEHHIWLVITDLKKDYLETIKNYQKNSYGEATFLFFIVSNQFLILQSRILFTALIILFLIYWWFFFLSFFKIETN